MPVNTWKGTCPFDRTIEKILTVKHLSKLGGQIMAWGAQGLNGHFMSLLPYMTL